ncbi:hypothetical protein PUN28_003141 [Cardiocondyla obscurior]|uniref:Uncharacterized protein n=1 Tax=Cardiocondyla obscurior TaxID=286306 RepID=A0AAW2GJ05_9HYME
MVAENLEGSRRTDERTKIKVEENLEAVREAVQIRPDERQPRMTLRPRRAGDPETGMQADGSCAEKERRNDDGERSERATRAENGKRTENSAEERWKIVEGGRRKRKGRFKCHEIKRDTCR